MRLNIKCPFVLDHNTAIMINPGLSAIKNGEKGLRESVSKAVTA